MDHLIGNHLSDTQQRSIRMKKPKKSKNTSKMTEHRILPRGKTTDIIVYSQEHDGTRYTHIRRRRLNKTKGMLLQKEGIAIRRHEIMNLIQGLIRALKIKIRFVDIGNPGGGKRS